MKKKQEIEESNIFNDLFYSIPDRKNREISSTEEDDEYFKELERKKRARIEALLEKSK